MKIHFRFGRLFIVGVGDFVSERTVCEDTQMVLREWQEQVAGRSFKVVQQRLAQVDAEVSFAGTDSMAVPQLKALCREYGLERWRPELGTHSTNDHSIRHAAKPQSCSWSMTSPVLPFPYPVE